MAAALRRHDLKRRGNQIVTAGAGSRRAAIVLHQIRMVPRRALEPITETRVIGCEQPSMSEVCDPKGCFG